jgi:predicted ATPase/transcriptional regulator with XRE-family HTH domain
MEESFSFGYWLRRQRLARDLRQVDLAALLGIAPITLRKIEADERRPSLQLATRVAAVFELDDAERALLLRVARADLSPAALPSPTATAIAAGALPRPGQLPAATTTLIGRASDVAAIIALLARPEVRLATLIGPGGTGKTRLALAVAAGLSGAGAPFPDGVWFVGLAPIRDPQLVLPAIARVLGISERAGHMAAATLADTLRDRRLLLVLDNMEQVVAAAQNLGELLAAAPALKLLVTSRARLHLSGEHLVPVAPLPTPPREAPQTVEALGAYDAVQLFVERARLVRPGFELTPDNAPVIAALCTRLEGLPLAIELAAARLRLLAPEALLPRLDHRLNLLTGGARDLPARQQTLRQTVGWSYDLLGAGAQRLFRKLAVFVGGCPLAAVPLAAGAPEELGAFDELAELVDQSLLVEEDGPDGEPRFRMLETVREYAQELLGAGDEGASAREWHAAFFRSLVARAAPELRGPQAAVWLSRLEAEHDNLRAALEWLAERGAAHKLAELCEGLWRYWWVHGFWREGRAWLERSLALFGRAGTDPPAAAVVERLLLALGWMHYGMSNFTAARQIFEERLAAGIAPADPRLRAGALLGLGLVGYGQGDYRRALNALSDALAAFHEAGDVASAAQTLSERSFIAYIQGDLDAAEADEREALALARAVGFRQVEASALQTQGQVALARQSYAEAAAALSESLAIARGLGDRQSVSSSLNYLGSVAHAQGAYAEAAACWEEALQLRRALGNRRGAMAMQVSLASAAWASGDLSTAVAQLVEALRQARELQYGQGYHWCLLIAGNIASSAGRAELAARLFGAADALASSHQLRIWPETLADYERSAAAARAALGEAAFAAAWEAGRALPLGDALDLAAHPLPAERSA